MKATFYIGKRQNGVTLVELLIAIAVLGILVALALPSFQGLIERKNLEGAAEKLFADLQFAKSEAIKRNLPVNINFNNSGSNWCYGMKINASCDCTETDNTSVSYCQIDGVKKVVSQNDYPNIRMYGASQPFSGELILDNRRGTAEDGGVTFINNYEIRVKVNTLGRIKICRANDDASKPDLQNYPAC